MSKSDIRLSRILPLQLALLGAIGPFAIDAYLPAFSGIGSAIGASALEMQQTLSVYLFAFALMNLLHGAISDSVGRRPVVLCGIAVFGAASIGCALATNIGALLLFRGLQGLSAGAGIVVSRALIRDLYPPDQAQRVMSRVTIYFGLAPAIAPLIGGWLFVALGWAAIFWFLATFSAALWAGTWRWLPETLKPEHRQRFSLSNLARGYGEIGADPRFLLLALASGVPFNGMFVYVLSAPSYLGSVLGLQPTQFLWFFLATIVGIMSGAWSSGRAAGVLTPRRQIRIGFTVMLCAGLMNVCANLLMAADARWAFIPVIAFAYGWALMVPAITLLALDLAPARRGMVSSLHAAIGSAINGLVAGVIAPWLMDSAVALAVGSVALIAAGALAWLLLLARWPAAAAGHARPAP